jgi:hypothetical protein
MALRGGTGAEIGVDGGQPGPVLIPGPVVRAGLRRHLRAAGVFRPEIGGIFKVQGGAGEGGRHDPIARSLVLGGRAEVFLGAPRPSGMGAAHGCRHVVGARDFPVGNEVQLAPPFGRGGDQGGVARDDPGRLRAREGGRFARVLLKEAAAVAGIERIGLAAGVGEAGALAGVLGGVEDRRDVAAGHVGVDGDHRPPLGDQVLRMDCTGKRQEKHRHCGPSKTAHEKSSCHMNGVCHAPRPAASITRPIFIKSWFTLPREGSGENRMWRRGPRLRWAGSMSARGLMELMERLAKERRARLAAERLLEQRTRELFAANEKLAVHARSLSDQIVEQRQVVHSARSEAEELKGQNSRYLHDLEPRPYRRRHGRTAAVRIDQHHPRRVRRLRRRPATW